MNYLSVKALYDEWIPKWNSLDEKGRTQVMEYYNYLKCKTCGLCRVPDGEFCLDCRDKQVFNRVHGKCETCGKKAKYGMDGISFRCESHRENYIDVMLTEIKLSIESLVLDTLRAPLSDRRRWSLYEFFACVQSGMIPWNLVPPHIKELVNLPAKDYGVDGCSLDLKESLQVKYRGDSKKVCFRELSTFFTLSTLMGANRLRLITTEETKIARPGNLLIPGKIEHSELSVVMFDSWLAEMENGLEEIVIEEKKEGSITLRPYQVEALKAIKEFEGDEMSLRLPCGSGKTYIIREAIRGVENVVIFVPSKLLLTQVGMVIGECHLVSGGHQCEEKSGVFVCVYNSVDKLPNIEWDIVVIDEGHHFDNVDSEVDLDTDPGNQTYRNKIMNLEYKKRLLFSATFEEEGDFSYSMEKAIEEGYLCDYDIVIPVVSPGADIKKCLVDLINRRADFTHILAYCNTVVEAEQFRDLLIDAGISCASFNGTTPMAERESILRQFKLGKIQVLSTAYVLSEGIDIPIANVCMFVQPRFSSKNIIQCVGRVLRLYRGKTLSHIVLPTTDEEKMLRSFLRSMSAIDTRVKRSIVERKVGRINFENLENGDVERDADYYIEIYDRFGKSVMGWDDKLNLIAEFFKANGKPPKQKEEYKGVKIGSWLNTQRNNYKNKKLLQDRIEKLNALNLLDGIDPDEPKKEKLSWDDNYNLVTEFYQANGRKPKNKEEYKGVKIGSWLNDQRKNYKNKKLLQDQIEKLNVLNLLDGIDLNQEKLSWDDKYNLVAEFCKANGRPPKQKEEYKDVKIGKWLDRQRQNYKNKKLLQDQIEKLNVLNLLDGVDLNQEKLSWDDKYNLVTEFYAVNGRPPKSREKYEGVKIGIWVTNQKQNYKKGIRLQEDRIEKLNVLNLLDGVDLNEPKKEKLSWEDT